MHVVCVFDIIKKTEYTFSEMQFGVLTAHRGLCAAVFVPL